MLRDMAKHPAGRPPNNRLQAATDFPTLADLGINRMASHRWQTMADGATLEATAAAAGVDPKTVSNWTRGTSDLENSKSEVVNARGQKRPATYRPRAV